jgi:N6-adenosine-specific RNA methylase IME4
MEFHEVANIFPLMHGNEFEDLVSDIKANGLREAIWTYQGKIIDGRNRFRACSAAGIKPHFIEWDGQGSLIAFIVSLNLHRRHLDASQRAMVAARCKPMFEEEAKARMLEGRNQYSPSANLREADTGKASDKAAEAVNVSPRSVEYASKVVAQGIPELVQSVESGSLSVSAAADIATLPKPEQQEIVARGKKEILEKAKDIRSERAAEIRAQRDTERTAALKIQPPTGLYRTIVVDPPWPIQKLDRDVRPNQVASLDYPTMSLEEIKAFVIPATEAAHLYLWTTQKYLPAALTIMEAWGFKYLFTMVWHKPGGFQPFGLPQYNCEFILFGRKGGIDFLDTKAFPTCFSAPRREHSRKPDEFYELVNRVSPGPRIDIFTREHHDGFDGFGNETDKFLSAQ